MLFFIFLFREKNFVDSLLQRLENYSLHLEEKVEERTELYKSEKDRADSLLYQMLPKGVADQLKRGNVSHNDDCLPTIVLFQMILHLNESLKIKIPIFLKFKPRLMLSLNFIEFLADNQLDKIKILEFSSK